MAFIIIQQLAALYLHGVIDINHMKAIEPLVVTVSLLAGETNFIELSLFTVNNYKDAYHEILFT